MKSRARESLETPQQKIECADQGVASNLPTICHLKRNLRCRRQRNQMSIPLPLSTQDLNIPDEFKVTKKNEQFLSVTIMLGFEKAMHNAMKLAFPSTEIKGCFFFHLCQNIYRNIQESGNSKLYAESLEFAVSMRMISALAFSPTIDNSRTVIYGPTNKVTAAFETFSEIILEEAIPIMDYFGRYLHW